jgi:bacillithiol synthase
LSTRGSPLVPARPDPVTPDVEIIPSQLQGGGALVRDYRSGAAALEPFFVGHPGDAAAYRRKAAEVDARLDAAARAAVAPAITPFGDAEPRLRQILDGNGYFVTTGQQPALFGGPLYTLYKVLGAIRLAATLEAELDRPVLALFWIGADDHDWDEANHVSMLDAQRYVQRVAVRALADADAAPVALSERTWGAGIADAVEEAVSLLPDGAASDAVAEHLRAAYTAGDTVAGSFTATMALLLRDRRVAVVNSAHPALRRTAAPVLLREVQHASAHFTALRQQTDRLEAAGYGAQVELTEGASNLMLHTPDGRDRLMHDAAGNWRTRRQQRRAMSQAALLERIEAEPDAFSANVLLRPVVESTVFPTVAYVAGPGELSYFAQIGCLFRAHGIAPPVVVPRPSVTFVEPKVRRVLDRHGLDPDAVRRPYTSLLTDVVRGQVPVAATAALERIRHMLHELYGEAIAATEAVDPTLRGPLTAARNWSTVRALEAEKRIVRHMKRRDEVLAEQLRRVSASLFPDGAPQERVLNILPLVARYGPGIIGAVEDSLNMTLTPVARWDGLSCD